MVTLPHISTILPVSRGVQCVKEIISSLCQIQSRNFNERERERERDRQSDSDDSSYCVFIVSTHIIKLFSIHNLLLIMCSNSFNLLHCKFHNTI